MSHLHKSRELLAKSPLLRNICKKYLYHAALGATTMMLLLSIYAVSSQHAAAVTVYNAQKNQLESNRSLSANTGESTNSSRTVTSITFKVKECKINNTPVSCTTLSKLINSLKMQASLSAAMASPNGAVIAAILEAVAAVIAIIGSTYLKRKKTRLLERDYNLKRLFPLHFR